MKINVPKLFFPLVFWLVVGCSPRDDDVTIEGPGLPTGPGIVYPVKDVAFTTVDSVEISARYGHPDVPRPYPVVILVHDIGETSSFIGGSSGWSPGCSNGCWKRVFPPGHRPARPRQHTVSGRRPSPGGPACFRSRQLPPRRPRRPELVETEPSADIARVGIVGTGVGGNVAFVSMGAFPGDLQAGVALSPGVFDPGTLEPLAIGAGVEDFSPHSMMFLVAENDIRQVSEDLVLSYAAFAEVLNDFTDDPKNLVVYKGQDAHGLDLLENPDVVDALLSWLEQNL